MSDEISWDRFRTITELLREACVGRKEQTLFVQLGEQEDQPITFGQWEHDLLRLAGKLRDMDAQHIGVVCDLTYRCVLCLHAVIVAGKVLVPLSTDMDSEVLEEYIRKADVDLLLYNEERIEEPVRGCASMLISDAIEMPGAGMEQWPEWEEDREACIFFTSGTEGTPNGVVLTQKNMAMVNSYSDVHVEDRAPRTLLFLPLHHVLTFVAMTLSILDGCEIHLSRSIKYVAQELEKVKPDYLMSVPMVNELFRSRIVKGIEESGKGKQLERLVRFSNGLRKIGIDRRTQIFRKFRESLGGIPQLIISGGAASSEDTLRFFADYGIIIAQGYGMTEAASTVASNTVSRNRIGSVGQLMPFNEVRIKDSEIQVRGKNIMKGYYKDPELTARSFDEGWFKTGDLGYMDEAGYLYITGRKKNLIILNSGENVSPEELEQRLMESPWIEDALVLEKSGAICAEILPKTTRGTDMEQVEKGIAEAVDTLNRKNPTYKRIASWELRTEPFEKNASLKKKR